MKGKIVMLGGGGHSRVLIDLIRLSGKFEIACILDPELETGSTVMGVPVQGDESLLPGLFKNGIINACVAVGSVKENGVRMNLYEKVREIGFSVPYLIHPSTIISAEASFSDGVQVMAGTIVQAISSVGENTIVNTGAIVEHDCRIGKHVHICPGAVISGGCVIGDGSFIGAGATVIHGVSVGKSAKIGAGAVVIKDVPQDATVSGVPAK